MGIETILFKSEEKKSTKEVSDFLRLLADKLETGQVILKQNDTELTLEIPNTVTMEVKAESEEKRKGTLLSLEVEIEWYEGAEDKPDGSVTLG